MAIKHLMGAALLVGLGLAGCDQSKAELDSTKQQLQAVTAERDSLKSQLDATKAQLAAAQQQMDQMKQAAATPPTAPSGAAATPPKEHHASKGGDAAGADPGRSRRKTEIKKSKSGMYQILRRTTMLRNIAFACLAAFAATASRRHRCRRHDDGDRTRTWRWRCSR